MKLYEVPDQAYPDAKVKEIVGDALKYTLGGLALLAGNRLVHCDIKRYIVFVGARGVLLGWLRHASWTWDLRSAYSSNGRRNYSGARLGDDCISAQNYVSTEAIHVRVSAVSFAGSAGARRSRSLLWTCSTLSTEMPSHRVQV